MKQEICCVIPARGGSKRIPRKNIKDFCGKPMIAYSISAALGAAIFDSILVSTDDQEIAEISIKLGASVPKLRDLDLSTDFTPTLSVIQDAIKMLNLENSPDSIVMCLYPTSVHVRESDILDGIRMFKEQKGCKPLLTLIEYSHPIARAFLQHDGEYSPINPEIMDSRTQDLPRNWYDAGQFYIAKVSDWISEQGPKAPFIAKIFESHEVSDIDTVEDFERSELLLEIQTKLGLK